MQLWKRKAAQQYIYRSAKTLFLNRENYYKFQLQIQNSRRYL